MSKRVFIFPGQGSQYVGMGKELAESFAEAKEVFQEVDDTLSQNLSKIIFEGPIEELTMTENTQPALMATSIAVLKVLQKQSGKNIEELCDYVAGHSLGEYSALCAAGAISLNETAKLLKIRGSEMQKAVPAGQGGMAAVIGLSFNDVEKLVNQTNSDETPIQIANDNSDGQIVVSGSMHAIDAAEPIAKDLGAKRYLKLPVSAPFHSSLMSPAAIAMETALGNVDIQAPKVPVIANVTAEQTSDSSEIKNLLVEQVTGRVRWRETVMNFAAKYDISSSVEVGAGKVLTGLSKRINGDIETFNIEKPQEIEGFLNQ